MRLLFRLALRQLLNHRSFSLFFLVNLTIGLSGFLALEGFKHSLNEHLGQRSKSILTADLSMRSRQPFSPEVRDYFKKKLPPETQVSQKIRMYSMVAGNELSQLVQLLAVDANYPLYGEIRLQNQGLVTAELTDRQLRQQGKVWIYPDLLIALGLKVGERIKIGEQHFEIADVVLEDPTNSFGTTGLAPRIYLALEWMPKTELIRPGSRVFYQDFFRFPLEIDSEALAAQLRHEFPLQFPDHLPVRVITHQEASEQVGRLLTQLNRYMGLMGLTALLLALLGAAYLFRSYLTENIRQQAILISLGTSRLKAQAILLIQLLMLGGAASVLAILPSALLLPLLPLILQQFIPLHFQATFGLTDILMVVTIGTLGSILACLPLLTRLFGLQPQMLFQEHASPKLPARRHALETLVASLPVLLFVSLLALRQAESLKMGGVFLGVLAGSLVVLGLLCRGLLTVASMASEKTGVTGKIALRNLHRNRLAVISCFLAIGLGTMLINLVVQIQAGLQQEISRPENTRIPNFFLFDIQPEQVAPLEKFLQEQGHAITNLSPLIRARLTEINGKPVENRLDAPTLGEEDRDRERFRTRSYNLSYRGQMRPGEVLLEGAWFDLNQAAKFGDVAEVSVEEWLGKQLEVGLGDQLTFNIQGIPITTQITSLRNVQWNTFEPNFFVIVQPGMLEEAPQSFLASIHQVPEDKRPQLQSAMVQEFPNISIVDVTRLVQRLLGIADQIGWAVRLMAWLAVISGLVVLYSIARHEAHTRLVEVNLLKVLGASFGRVRQITQLEFALLGGCAALTGVGLSLAATWVFSTTVFEQYWSIDWAVALISVLVVTLMSTGTALLAIGGVLKAKPIQLLKAV